jgi:hypothetical protein
MKSRQRHATLLLSATALAVIVAIGSAEASGWLPAGLISRLTGQPSPAPIAAAGTGPVTGTDPALAANTPYHDGSYAGPAYNTYYGPFRNTRPTVAPANASTAARYRCWRAR